MGRLHLLDKVVPFLKKCLYLVASKLSLEVVPFCKTQANSGDHSAQSTQTVVGEHARNASPETEAK